MEVPLYYLLLGSIEQLVACLTADPAWPHNFLED